MSLLPARVRFEMEMEDRAYAQRARRRLATQARRDPERTLEPIENTGSSENKNPEKLGSN
jgi:hypothetical protein